IDGRPYLLMELVAGPSLKECLKQGGGITDYEARVLLRQMAEALRHAWDNGFTHRDVKPANIVIDVPRSGHREPFCAKLCDFGLAKFREDIAGHQSDLTRQGVAVGTPHYMSP